MRLAATLAGRGTPIVLVHGFTQTGRSWRYITTQLIGDHEVTTVDAPGHGGSSTLRLDLWGGADALVATGGKATYVGYSMGGRLCLHAALSHPTSIDRLVLLGAAPGIDDAAQRSARRRADDALATDIEHDGVDSFLTRWLANPMFSGLPVDPADIQDRRRNTAAGLASSLRLAGSGAQEPLWDRLSELVMPVLVLAGEHDTKFTGIGRAMAASIGDNASFGTVPDAGHSAHLEQPEAFLRLVRRFLAA